MLALADISENSFGTLSGHNRSGSHCRILDCGGWSAQAVTESACGGGGGAQSRPFQGSYADGFPVEAFILGF